MEENRRFSWTDLFIKVIIVIIFVLFTVWLLSLSTKGVSNSLDVLTDNIFSENIEKMKEVGKGYFTTERLPKKIGDIETITLEEMYKKKLILELKDKNGNACDAEDSYVSIEKMENEYQMKVNLECGEEEDYIIVIMGCYDYCDTDICEKDETMVKDVEYQYKKTTGGKWTDYGKWSEWSKVAVSKNNYRQVETKIEEEKYSYDKEIIETVYASFETTCPSGYKKTSDGTKCYKEVSTTDTVNPTCPTVSGYKLVNRDEFTCNYSKSATVTVDPVCPTISGYKLLNRDEFTCNYSVPYKAVVGKELVSTCSGCAAEWQTIYETRYRNETKSATCPDGYSQSGTTCTKTTVVPETGDAECPSGYSQLGNTCSKTVTSYDYKNLIKTCPVGYEKTEDNKQCYKNVPSIVKITGTKEVTYYRYRVREYVGGTTDYKWSKSKNDKDLLNAGYKLTGKTR